jgi:dnd system-associated protein 4
MSVELADSRESVYIEQEVHEHYQRLTEGQKPAQAPFDSMKDLFMWAACLGARRGIRRPLDSKKVKIFGWTQFDLQVDVPLLKAIALVTTGDPQVILRRSDVLTIAEEYANAGIHELVEKIEEHPGDPLWNLLEFLLRESLQREKSNV